MDEIATWKQNLEKRKQILHVLAASYVQSRKFIASTVREL